MSEQKTKQVHKWRAPPPGQLKINSDDAFIQETLTGGWGFIKKNFAYLELQSSRLDAVPDVITAETAACVKALQSATDYEISRIQLEVDSSVLKEALQSSTMDLAASGMLLRDTRDLLQELLHFVCGDVL